MHRELFTSNRVSAERLKDVARMVYRRVDRNANSRCVGIERTGIERGYTITRACKDPITRVMINTSLQQYD